MSEGQSGNEPSTTNNTTTTAPTPTVGATTTRNQHQRNNAEIDAIDDGEKSAWDHKRKEKDKDTFKGKVDKLDGNVFQLSEEGRKGNQFTVTLEALEAYTTTEYESAKDLRPLFENPCRIAKIKVPSDQPPMLSDKVTRATRDHRAYIDWKFECETYNTRVVTLEKNQYKLFAIILLQCSLTVKNKLEASVGYSTAKANTDCVWLLTTLKNICHKFEHTENRFVALVNAKFALFNYRQGQQQTTTDYFESFKELLSVLEAYGGRLHDPESAAPPSTAEDFTELNEKERDDYMRERYCATLFLRNSDNQRYGQLKHDLSTDFAKKRDEYPQTLVEAHQLLLSTKPPPVLKQPPSAASTPRPPCTDGGRGGGRHSHYNRGGRSGKMCVQVAFSLAQVDHHFPNGIPSHFVLLDSDSTVSIFCNAALLTDIHDVAEPLYLETNGGGYQVSTQMGTLKDFGLVWYNPDSIANVLSLAQVRLVRRVTMDTAISAAFHVHKVDGSGTTLFVEHESGLYLHDASVSTPTVVNHSSQPVVAYSCLQTVAANKTQFTTRQVEAADAARKLYRLIGRPGYSRFLSTLKDNLILNCPLTVDDAQRAEFIYGKDVAFLKGKTTASPAKTHVPDFVPTVLPPELLSLHPNVTLCLDNFFVLSQSFCLTVSRNLRYLSCHPIADRFKPTLTACIKSDLALYSQRGFTPTDIHADGEFNSQRDTFPNIHFTICSADDHVPEIERAIRSVKENIRATIHGMPYARLPRVLVKELATHATRTINMLPHPDGVSSTLSPATIVTGAAKPDYRTLSLEFGTYVQVYDGTSNDTKSRTLGAIATNPTGNTSGDYYFMSLATGQRIHRRSWTVLPISDSVISRVESIATNEGMPPVDEDHLLNEYDPDAIVDPAEYDRNYAPPLTPDPASDHDLTTDAYTDESDDDDDDSATDDVGHHPVFDDDVPLGTTTIHLPPTLTVDEERHTNNHITKTVPESTGTTTTTTIIETATDSATNTPPVALESVGNEERTHPSPITDHEEPTTVENEERATVENEERTTVENEERNNVENEARTRPPGLRPKPTKNHKYGHNFTQLSTPTTEPTTTSLAETWRAIETMPSPPTTDNERTPMEMKRIHKAIVGLMFTQMSAHKGIKKHGQRALNALRKEFLQFKALNVLEPLDAFKLTDEQKAAALRAISVIKEKRDGTIKGRTCADGSSQQGHFSKAETGSPTISNDALFMSIMIDAHENRDVATADIAGAYLHALMKEFIAMRFVGWAVDLLCEVNPEYKKFVVYEGNVKVLYVRCNKAIYGCVVSGVLWYELFTETLEKLGFSVNPYDFCIANATIEGSQCTIGWFVDDTKISHIKSSVVSNIVQLLEDRFGKMKVTRGRSHKFLGMNIKFLGDGSATIHMPSYISEALTESGLDVTKTASTPCANTLLSVDETSPLLPIGKAKSFHSVVAKLIYVGTRARTDILLALSFLCGRVSSPTEQDEYKLQRLLRYLNATINLPLRLGADSLNQFSTWVDASFAVHPDMRSHTGGVISFGRGGIICKSKKQNINTKSSTEAELIGASDYLPNTLFVKLFMEAQGYPISKATFHQDNESAIKMEQNGKASCGQRSRHIAIRYFFITDHSKRNDVSIVHCPTEDMLADFFTKPLQGSLFRKFRSVLLGEAHTNTLIHALSSLTNEERVGSKKDPSVHTNTTETGISKSSNTDYLITTIVENKDSIKSVNSSHSIENYPEDINI